MIRRRTALTLPAAAFALQPWWAEAQGSKKDSLVLAMTLEPPGLDPTANAASAIGEVVLYNVFETLTKIHGDSTVTPLLAQVVFAQYPLPMRVLGRVMAPVLRTGLRKRYAITEESASESRLKMMAGIDRLEREIDGDPAR